MWGSKKRDADEKANDAKLALQRVRDEIITRLPD